KWTSPIYGFYHSVPTIEYVNSHCCHTFRCASRSCTYQCCHYLDTSDANSTGNLRKHLRLFCGTEALVAAEQMNNVNDVRENIVKGLNESGSITASFERKGKGKVTYSNCQHTRAETRTEISLMKTGRPEYYLPSLSTVACNVKTVFAGTRQRIAKLLQEHNGELNFATDAWTLPNHRAYVAVTVHLEVKGEPLCMILDVVEVEKLHTGIELASTFAKMLEDFGISEKVCLT
ncbi:hypothetical protein BV22DRAFT_1026831, partial [Leucogyrophana mollusca]